jgi:hypothetical protein
MSITPRVAACLTIGLAACAESPTGLDERPQQPAMAQNEPCPDFFEPVPALFDPNADKNGNFIICLKSRPNGANTTDDKIG